MFATVSRQAGVVTCPLERSIWKGTFIATWRNGLVSRILQRALVIMFTDFLKLAPVTDADSGAAMVEFAIVLPLILTFLFGIVEVGRLFSQVTWYSSLNYESVVSGSLAPAEEAVVNTEVNSAFHRLHEVYLQTGNTRLSGVPVISDEDEHSNIADRTVKIESSAAPRSILKDLGLDFAMKYTGRILSKGSLPVDHYAEFRNPTVLYNCSNQPGGSASGPCNWSLINP